MTPNTARAVSCPLPTEGRAATIVAELCFSEPCEGEAWVAVPQVAELVGDAVELTPRDQVGPVARVRCVNVERVEGEELDPPPVTYIPEPAVASGFVVSALVLSGALRACDRIRHKRRNATSRKR